MRSIGVMALLIAGFAAPVDACLHMLEPTDCRKRAIEAATDATGDPRSATPATEADSSLADDQNRRAVSNCLTSRGLPAETCRQRQPNQDVPLSRARARNLEDRYHGTAGRPGPSSRFPSARSGN